MGLDPTAGLALPSERPSLPHAPLRALEQALARWPRRPASATLRLEIAEADAVAQRLDDPDRAG